MKKADERSYLNQKTLRALYPELPQEAAEQLRLRQIYLSHKEEPKVKKKLSLALVVSMVAVMIAVVAIAEMSTGVISNYLQKKQGIELTEDGQSLFARAKPVSVHEFEDIIFTVTEAATDGQSLFVGAVVKPKPGHGVLLAIGETEGYDIVPYGKDGENYADMAKRTGKKIVTAAIGYNFNDQMTCSLGDDYDEDGTMYLFLSADIGDHQNIAELTLSMEVSDYDPAKGYTNFQKHEWLEKLASYTPEVKELSVGQNVPDTDIHVQSVKLSLTPISLYYEIRTTGSKTDSFLEFFDAENRRIDGGANGLGSAGMEGQVYIQKGSLNLTKFPEALFLRSFDGEKGEAMFTENPDYDTNAAYSEALRIQIR